MTRSDASEAQNRAADPAFSTWLSANAGSGKTRVLIDRVARLLLDEVPPDRILCLTYTRAAATEMQNRLFERLGEWAMLDDIKLRGQLDELGLENSRNVAALRTRARTLFARAIETPGGLKIQTIHSFCAALLRRFPVEAGVAPGFSEMDDRSALRLRSDVLDTLAGGKAREAFDGIARYLSDENLDRFIQTLVSHRQAFTSAFDRSRCLAALGYAGQEPPEKALESVLTVADAELLAQLVPLLLDSSKTDVKAGEKLSALLNAYQGPDWLPVLEDIFLFKTGPNAFLAKTEKFSNKSVRTKLGERLENLYALMQRVEDARNARLALATADKTEALFAFARSFLPRLEATKSARAALDFDDLILKARALLTDPGVAQWVLFRLDGGIDHILVDEAQDTSPSQWEIVQLLAREFAAGKGARSDTRRTIFVVGDPKQSIYSFQGADPQGFEQMRAYFSLALEQVRDQLHSRELLHSFRSSPAILRAVDDTFQTTPHQGFSGDIVHKPFFPVLPGRVDLWPAVPQPEKPEKAPFDTPVNTPSPDRAELVLANAIVSEIGRILASGTCFTDDKGNTRPLTPGDFLILVQRRSLLFHELIRACKTADLPIAGADRLRIGAELAVKDLIALLSFAATPEDSLSLASVLRSPLVGLSQADLYDLAHKREGRYLWPELRRRSADFADAVAFLGDIRDQADFLRPYDLIDRCLTRHGGRKKLTARLGYEAEDGIDALLAQAMIYERSNIPSLTGFLGWFGEDRSDLKRPLDNQADAIRVMSVHGAKGLESPVVILPDCAKRRPRSDSGLVWVDTQLVWAGKKGDATSPLRDALDARAEKDEAERNRLLYVAMTRARNWLIVAAAGEAGGAQDSWFARVEAGLEHAGALGFGSPTGVGKRLEHGNWPAPQPGGPTVSDNSHPTRPVWTDTHAPKPEEAPVPLSPSDLGGAKVLLSDTAGSGADAMARGDLIHWLLERLPDLPRDLWDRVMDQRGEPESVCKEVRDVLTATDLTPIFAPDTLAEVQVAAKLPELGGRLVAGTIDRLLLGEDRILVVDYKSNAVVPDAPEATPEGLLRQMGAYVAILNQIYPDKPVECAILWTSTATLMPLPHALVRDALQRAAPS